MAKALGFILASLEKYVSFLMNVHGLTTTAGWAAAMTRISAILSSMSRFSISCSPVVKSSGFYFNSCWPEVISSAF